MNAKKSENIFVLNVFMQLLKSDFVFFLVVTELK